MKMLTALPLLALAGVGLSKPCGCKHDKCYKDVVGGDSFRNTYDNVVHPDVKDQCSSYLASTVTPSAVTVTQTAVVNVTPTSFSSNTETDTESTTATEISSVVETDTVPITTTTTITETTTETVVGTETVTTQAPPNATPPGNPFKRRTVSVSQTAAATATDLPSHAGDYCNAQQYASVCHCIGVSAPTVTATASTVTETATATVTGATQVIETIVTTVTETTTVATSTTTVTFSTDFVTTTVATESSFTTVPTTETSTTTTTSLLPGPTQAVYLRAIGSDDPALAPSGGLGFPDLESFRGSTYVFYLDFTTNAASQQLFGIDTDTGRTVALNGPGTAAGEPLCYSTFGGAAPASYVNIATDDFCSSQGGVPVKCHIKQGSGFEQLECRWGNDQIADFWTCRGRLNFVRPGYDFSQACTDASTSYKIPLIQVVRA